MRYTLNSINLSLTFFFSHFSTAQIIYRLVDLIFIIDVIMNFNTG